MGLVLCKLNIKPKRWIFFFVNKLRLRVKLLIVKFGRSSVLSFSVEKSLVIVEYNLVGLLKDVSFPSFNTDNSVLFGVFDHPSDVFVIVQIVAKSNIPMRRAECSS